MMVRQAHHERFLWVQGNGKALSSPLSFNVNYAVLKSIERYNNFINIFSLYTPCHCGQHVGLHKRSVAGDMEPHQERRSLIPAYSLCAPFLCG